MVVDAGAHTISEIGVDGTDILTYGGSVECSGTGFTLSSQTQPAERDIVLENGAVVECTITNIFGVPLGVGTLVINKTAIGIGDTVFSYTASSNVPGTIIPDNSNVGPFSIETSGGTGISFQTVLAAPGHPALVTLSESILPSGWDFTSLECTSDNGKNSTFTYNGSSVDILFQDEDSVTCTFTNTQKGHLIVQKTTNPAGDPTEFSINATGDGTITGGGAGTITDVTDKDYEVTPGTYSVSETVPNGWAITEDTCQNVEVAAGETVTCTITNTKEAKITLEKVCDPDDATNQFNFSSQRGSDAPTSLDPVTCGDKNVVIVPPTTDSGDFTNWTITETNSFGWIIKNITCTGDDNISYSANSATVDLDAGENVKCIFTNEAPPTGRMTGGGSYFPINGDSLLTKNTRITHGFNLHCNPLVVPNRLEVNWAGTGKNKAAENNFHLTSLTSASCINDPDIDEQAPV